MVNLIEILESNNKTNTSNVNSGLTETFFKNKNERFLFLWVSLLAIYNNLKNKGINFFIEIKEFFLLYLVYRCPY